MSYDQVLRRRHEFPAAITAELDLIYEELNRLRALARSGARAEDRAFNDSTSLVGRWLIYGVGAETITPAVAGGASAVRPAFQALEAAAPGMTFRVAILGPSRVLLADPTAAATLGGSIWLSAASPGRVTPTRPASGARWWLGQFRSTIADPDGAIDAWLFIFPQAGGAL